MYIHTYSSDGGILTHQTTDASDRGGRIGVTGDVEALLGWPTSTMRRAVDGTGNVVLWYVGTDANGQIVNAQTGLPPRG